MATVKRLTRTPPDSAIPDSWDKVDPWGPKSQEFIRAATAKVEARKAKESAAQRAGIRSKVIEARRNRSR